MWLTVATELVYQVYGYSLSHLKNDRDVMVVLGMRQSIAIEVQ